MSEPFIGEIRVVSFGFPPRGWAFCNGQLLPIAQNQALFSILGTTYGGDGRTTFALPNLQGAAALHVGAGLFLGQQGGAETVTLNQSQLPIHTHRVSGSSANVNARTPVGGTWGASSTNSYGTGAPDVGTNPLNLTPVGGSQPHVNIQPYLVLNLIIALIGIFPSRN